MLSGFIDPTSYIKKKESDEVTENGNRNWTPDVCLRVLAVKKKKYLFYPSEQLKKDTFEEEVFS